MSNDEEKILTVVKELLDRFSPFVMAGGTRVGQELIPN